MKEQISIFEKPFEVMIGRKIGDIIDGDKCNQNQQFEIMVLGNESYAMDRYKGCGYLKCIKGTNNWLVDGIPFSNRPILPPPLP